VRATENINSLVPEEFQPGQNYCESETEDKIDRPSEPNTALLLISRWACVLVIYRIIRGANVKNSLLIVAVLIANLVFGQEVKHTTTKDLCREDQALWEAQLAKPASSWATVANDVDSKTLVLWASEMNDCSKVDRDRSQTYVDTVHWLFAVLFSRESDFLIRHHLVDQFNREDAAGAR
jgi:hypothetical protein